MVPHKDVFGGLPYDLDLAGCMGHDEPCPLGEPGACLPGLLEDLVGLFDRDLEDVVAGGRPALEDVVR